MGAIFGHRHDGAVAAIDDHGADVRMNAIQRGAEIAVEGRIEERDFDALPAQRCRCDQGLQRRIRLHLADLLRIRIKMIRVGQKN